MREIAEIGCDVEGEAVHGDPAGDPHPDGGHLAPLGPHPRIARLRPGVHPEVRQGGDERLLHLAHVGDDPLRVLEADDGVADELARAVVGDVAAAVDVEHLGADLGQLLR